MYTRTFTGLRALFVLVCGLPLVGACAGSQDAPDGGTEPSGDRLGEVALAASCGEAADPHLERGIALLHHMTYEPAEAAFSASLAADSGCALGYWGQAMTFVHPLWSFT